MGRNTKNGLPASAVAPEPGGRSSSPMAHHWVQACPRSTSHRHSSISLGVRAPACPATHTNRISWMSAQNGLPTKAVTSTPGRRSSSLLADHWIKPLARSTSHSHSSISLGVRAPAYLATHTNRISWMSAQNGLPTKAVTSTPGRLSSSLLVDHWIKPLARSTSHRHSSISLGVRAPAYLATHTNRIS